MTVRPISIVWDPRSKSASSRATSRASANSSLTARISPSVSSSRHRFGSAAFRASRIRRGSGIIWLGRPGARSGSQGQRSGRSIEASFATKAAFSSSGNSSRLARMSSSRQAGPSSAAAAIAASSLCSIQRTSNPAPRAPAAAASIGGPTSHVRRRLRFRPDGHDQGRPRSAVGLIQRTSPAAAAIGTTAAARYARNAA